MEGQVRDEFLASRPGPLGPEAATPAEDRLLGTTFRGEERGQAPAGAGRAVLATGLSAVMEGFGQAYNRQPAKALGFFVAGLGLSTASGLNTWLVRNVFGLKQTRIGPERINPVLLALWVATYGLNLWDAWRNAGRSGGRTTA